MTEAELQINETDAGLVVRLHVMPRAKRSEVAGVYNGALKIKVTAPPVDDAANRAIIEFLSKLLGISRSSLEILSGFKSRDKILKIKKLSPSEFLARISSRIS